MSLDKDKEFESSEIEHDCDCGDDCDCGEDCGCNDEGCGCGCGEDHEHEHTVTLTLEDGEELECPILDIFAIEDQEYIALLHPEDETVMLYKFFENDDESIEIDSIDDEDEFNLVSETFLSLDEE